MSRGFGTGDLKQSLVNLVWRLVSIKGRCSSINRDRLIKGLTRDTIEGGKSAQPSVSSRILAWARR